MDPICHTLVGANIAESGLKNRTALGTATLLVAANAPDIDVLSYFDGSYTALAFRRGVTHGALAWVVLPLLITGLALVWDRLVRRRGGRTPARPVLPKQLFLLALAGVLSHPLLDFLNTYGIRLLMPFSHRWFYGDTLFIVDPWVWAVLAAGFFLARRRSRGSGGSPGRRAGQPARWALVITAAYMLALSLSGLAARGVVRSALGSALAPDHLMVSPVPVNPFRRWVVYRAGDTVHFGTFDWFRSPKFVPEPYVQPAFPSSPAAARVRDDPDVQKFLGWARFPYAEVVRSGAELSVHLGDGRYSIDPADTWAGIEVTISP